MRQILEPIGEPTAETKRFNEWLEEVLKPAPPPGVIPAAELRRLRAEGKSVLQPDGPLPEAEWLAYDAASYGAPGGAGRVRLIEAAAAKGVYLHFHGGGWTIGAPEQADGRNLRLSRAAEVTVLSAQYRLAPENPWPACADDALAAARFAVDYARERELPLFIGGESAGGHLTAVALLRLRDEAGLGGAVSGAVFNYGCFDMRMTPSMAGWGARNMILSTPITDWFIGNVLPDRSLASRRIVSPILADLGGMPPALFQIGDVDPLIDDSVMMAERWRVAGARAELAFYAGGVHAFDLFDQPVYNLPIALEAQAATAEFLRGLIAARA